MNLVVIGGSDAGISAGLRAREVDPSCQVAVIVADGYPNFSICGIPYFISGDVVNWRDLAHRTHEDLDAAGLQLRLDTRALSIDTDRHQLDVATADGARETVSYDALVLGTGAVPLVPPIQGLTGPDALGPDDGVHLLHTMGETFALAADIARRQPTTALIVGAGYIGVEMAEALTARGIHVTQVDQLPEVLSTVDAELGALVRGELVRNGITVSTTTQVSRISRRDGGLHVDGRTAIGSIGWDVDLVLVVTGVRPDTGLRQLGVTYLPLGTTAHKQGRVAGANAVGGSARFAGSLGTQVVKVFDLVVARTGLRDHEAAPLGHEPATITSSPNDHKAYYPGAHPITISVTGDVRNGRLLGAQLVGRLGTEISKRVDIYASALFHNMTVTDIADLDLSYTPPRGSPWDAVQMAAQQWESRVTTDRTVPR